MPRASYGPETRKRVQHLVVTLLDFANDELDADEPAIDRLRPHIQCHWQTNQRLIIRTKVRHLEHLTQLTPTPLSGDQIREALKRLEDHLTILEDNRPSRQGSETWHFTLNLWHGRWERDRNLEQLVEAWERKSEVGTLNAEGKEKEKVGSRNAERGTSAANFSVPRSNFILPWPAFCQTVLQDHQQLTINPLLSGMGQGFALEDLYIPLDLVEERSEGETTADSEAEGGAQPIALDTFLQQIQNSETRQRLAIVGEPGAGKTTLLQRIAIALLAADASPSSGSDRPLPVWVSLADLQSQTLEQYLLNDWLKTATRKITVSSELQEAFAEQCNQGNVWLLLDALDEMALDASVALSQLDRQLRGWLADAHILLTCRRNVWHAEKNPLHSFRTYRNQPFAPLVAPLTASLAPGNPQRQQLAAPVPQPESPVQQFIQRWFAQRPDLSDGLLNALHRPENHRLRNAIQNPLRLALLCRTWTQTGGTLPSSKTALYQHFIDSLYAWKQDHFPTSLSQRQQLNHKLGHLALNALETAPHPFRPSHPLCHTIFQDTLDLLELALQLGWLTRGKYEVGTLNAEGGANAARETPLPTSAFQLHTSFYAFPHPTFQEYFAAQTIQSWHAFFAPEEPDRALSPRWREVLLLWFGRPEIDVAQKEACLDALIAFEDSSGGFYRCRAHFLAAACLAEFPEASQGPALLAQLIRWRFGEPSPEPARLWDDWQTYPAPLVEGARIALLQTDRSLAITALEAFLDRRPAPGPRWLAAQSLGKTFDPGNELAIAHLTELLQAAKLPALQLQVAHSLGQVAPSHPEAIATLQHWTTADQPEALRRKAAFYLGKIDTGNPEAIATLTELSQTASEPALRSQALQSLQQIAPGHELVGARPRSLQPAITADTPRSSRQRKRQRSSSDTAKAIAALTARLDEVTTPEQRLRVAAKLGQLQPEHPRVIRELLAVLRSDSALLRKRAAELLRSLLTPTHAKVIVRELQHWRNWDSSEGAIGSNPSPTQTWGAEDQEVYKLLWNCTELLSYNDFQIALAENSITGIEKN